MEPLAERMRPHTLDEYVGQSHLVGKNAVLRNMIDSGHVPSFILWGPPGVGKTTLAQIIANKLETPFYTLSAIASGVKDVRNVIERAKNGRFFNSISPILFIDEIHRFSKSQQDSLLGAVEKGIVTLIGATTENPSFEVIKPLLSRCQVYVLKSLNKEELLKLLTNAITQDTYLKKKNIELKETEALTILLLQTNVLQNVYNKHLLHTIKMEKCTIILSLPLSNQFEEAILMPHSIGWQE